jgi:hypothetical protein
MEVDREQLDHSVRILQKVGLVPPHFALHHLWSSSRVETLPSPLAAHGEYFGPEVAWITNPVISLRVRVQPGASDMAVFQSDQAQQQSLNLQVPSLVTGAV